MTNLKNVLNYDCISLSQCGTNKTIVSNFMVCLGGLCTRRDYLQGALYTEVIRIEYDV